MIDIKHSLRVTYADTDQMGYVYYGNYAKYLEIARVEFFRSLGISYKELEKNGIFMPVSELHINYKKPAFYDDILTIVTTIKEIPTGVRIHFDYEILNEANELITTAYTKLFFINKDSGRPIKCPEIIITSLERYVSKNSRI